MNKITKSIILSVFGIAFASSFAIANAQSASPSVTTSVTWNTPQSITYGTALSSTQLNATANVPGRFTYTPAAGTILQAGNQTLSVRFDPSDTSKFSVTKTVTLVVTKKFLTIKADNATKEQGSVNPAFTATYTGFVNGDSESSLNETASMTTTATKNSPIGSYDIIPGGAVSSNYAFNYLRGTLTVTAPNVSNQTYEISTIASGQGTISCIGCGKNVKNGTKVTAIATPALKYELTSWSGLGSSCPISSNSCEIIASASGDIIATFSEITPRVISFTATPETTAIGGGFVSLSAQVDKNVGPTSYYIKIYEDGVLNPLVACSSGTVCSIVVNVTSTKSFTARVEKDGVGQGTVNMLSKTVTVPGKKNPIVTWNTPESITYGAALTSTQLNASANIPGTFVYTPNFGAVLGAGNKTLSVTFTPTDSVQYNSITKTVTLQVIKKYLTIKANDTSKPQGSANPQFTATYTGFVNNDNVGSLDEGPSFTTDAKTNSPIGTYYIIPSNAQSPNYAFNYLRGTLSVVSSATLTAGLSADPSTGQIPPDFNTTLTASRSGTASGPITYKFKCNSTDAYSVASVDANYLCKYSAVGTYTASVEATQEGKTSTATLAISVTKDTTAPTASNIVAGPITEQLSTIRWDTDESSTGQIEYGLTSAYGTKTKEVATFDLSHSIQINGLKDNTTYHFRIISKDIFGNTSVTSDKTFKTAIQPISGSGELMGWAWSSNIGWISFNSKNPGSGGGVYAVNVKFDNDESNGSLWGYAWSPNIGWIQFDGLTGTVNGESVTNAIVNAKPGDPNYGKVTGWARAIGATTVSGWDGWIKLSGVNHPSPEDALKKGNEGVTYYTVDKIDNVGNRVRTGYLRGYAWGGEVVGWLKFVEETDMGSGGKIEDTVCITNCGGTTGGGADFTLTNGRNITVDLTNKTPVVIPGTVILGRINNYSGHINITRAGGNLPGGAIVDSLSPASCDLSSLAGQISCTVSVSVAGITKEGVGYYVTLNASDGISTKSITVPITFVDNSTKLKMWIKDGSNDTNETMSSKKVRLGNSVDVAWRSEVSGLSQCRGFVDGVPVISNQSPTGQYTITSSILDTVGTYGFRVECTSNSGIVKAKVIDSNGTVKADVLQITVTNSKIEEI